VISHIGGHATFGIRVIFDVLLGLIAALVIGALPRTAPQKAMAPTSAYVRPFPATLPGSMLGRPVLRELVISNAENLRHRATQLWLAQKARAIDLAEYIVERATQLFDEAIILEQSYKSTSRAL
jgi:hypothetical protein